MSRSEQHVSPGVDSKSSNLATDAASKSQLASRIQEKEHALAHAIALSGGPQSDPLRDRQILAAHDAADGILDVKRNRDRLDWLSAGRHTMVDPRNRSREDRPC